MEYRLERRGPRAVLLMHGGHMRASLSLGEEVFANAGYTVLAPSRPGYGRTPVTTGTSLEGFAEVAAELCGHLGIGSVAAVVGQSAGGPSAVTIAARCPELAERLILQSAVGPLAWPRQADAAGRQGRVQPHTEHLTWAHPGAPRPAAGLRLLLGGLSVQPLGRPWPHWPDRTLADALPNARLITSQAPGHFIWFGDDYPAIAAITSFLEADPAAPPGS